MDKRKQLLATLSFLALGAGYGATEANASADLLQCMVTGKSEAECACEAALEQDTLQALQLFLRDYPSAKTACNATASTLIVDRGGGGGEIGGYQ